MAINFPSATSVGETYTDPTSGSTFVCVAVGPPAQWVGSGSSTSLDNTYLRKDASNDPVTGQLEITPAIDTTGLVVTQPSGNTAAAMRITNEGSGNSLVIEDSASTDSSPIVADASGRLLVGLASANANGGVLQLSSGITFPAAQVSATDANTLDDYEEGTFTVTLRYGASSVTQGNGVYVKIGSFVHCYFGYMYGSAYGSPALPNTSAEYFLLDLPFTTSFASDPNFRGSPGYISFTSGSTTLSFPLECASSTQVGIRASANGGSWAGTSFMKTWTSLGISATAWVEAFVTYRVT